MPRYGGSLAFEAAMNESPYSQYDSGEDGMFHVIQMFENGELELGICLLEEIALKLQTNTNALLGFDEPTPVVASCICNCPLIRTGLLDHVLGEKKNG